MASSIVKKILSESEYCAKAIGKDEISPNILLHVLSLDSFVRAELIQNNADTNLINYVINPYHLKQNNIKKVKLSLASKDLIKEIDSKDTYLDIFKKFSKHKYISEMLAKCGYIAPFGNNENILSKYTKRIEGSAVKEHEIEKYEKLTKHLGKQNIMIMGSSGSGRYFFVQRFVQYNSKRFDVYYFDIFKYLKLGEERLFGIIKGVFEESKGNYLYIPDFLQAIEWIKSLGFNDTYLLLEDIAGHGKIITKVNKKNFDSKLFQLSKVFNFFSINVPSVTLSSLYEVLNLHATVFEKFYNISFSKDEIKNIIKHANFEDGNLAQPGKSLKRLMHLALTKYGNDESIMQKPKGSKHIIESFSLEKELKNRIIGQDKAIEEICREVSHADFVDGGVVKKLIFQGEIGCGKLKSARELSGMIFGEDSLRYIDLGMYNEYPLRFRVNDALDRIIETMYGGVIYLDNFDRFDVTDFDIVGYINMKIKELDFDGVIAPVIIIASIRIPVIEMQSYQYVIEKFDSVIHFSKLNIRDLEKIATNEIKKVYKLINNPEKLNPFIISANADSSLNALGVKKLITLMSLTI